MPRVRRPRANATTHERAGPARPRQALAWIDPSQGQLGDWLAGNAAETDGAIDGAAAVEVAR